MSVEQPAKIQCVVITCQGGDLADRMIGRFQQFLCVGQADIDEMLERCHAGIVLKLSKERADAETAARNVGFYIDILVDPVYGGVIPVQVDVFLKFLRMIENHISGLNAGRCVLVKIEIACSESDIDQLIINSSVWSASQKFRL